MVRKILLNFLILCILSIVISLLLTILGYVYNRLDTSTSIIGYILYYSCLTLIMQLIFCFWLIYFIQNKLKFNTIFISLIGGLLSLLLMLFISKMRFEAYYFEPFKHPYQIAIFFLLGFLYPYLNNRFLKNTTQK